MSDHPSKVETAQTVEMVAEAIRRDTQPAATVQGAETAEPAGSTPATWDEDIWMIHGAVDVFDDHLHAALQRLRERHGKLHGMCGVSHPNALTLWLWVWVPR